MGEEFANPADPRVGKVLQGRYSILGRIASGGMGSVYRGERLGLGRIVAVKFLHASMARDPHVMKRFEVEARAMSRLAHPNCIAVLDFGVDELPYLVMDYVQGAPLREAVERGPMVPRRAIKIARQLLSALGHAHAHGIIHRDIKPENIVLEATPGLTDHVRILDFGLAKLMGSDSGLTMGMAVGTPNYMAPEQTREGTVDFRADLYAVGIVLFEMLTGKKPFDSTEMGEVFLKQLSMPPPRLREVKPEARFSPALEAVVLRAMQKAPNDRFPDAEAMSQALEQVPEANATPGPEAVVISPGPLPDATVLQLTPPPLFSGEHTSPDAAPPEMALPAPAVSPMAEEVRAPVAAPVPLRRRRLTGAAPTRRSTWVGLAVVGAMMAVALVVGFRPRQPPAKQPEGGASATKSDSGHSASRAPATPAATPARAPAPALAEKRSAPEARTTAARSARSAGRNQRPGANAGAAAAQAREHFEARRWGPGIESFRTAARLEPARKSDRTLLNPLIASLDTDSKGERAAFLKELGPAARPALRDAARSHPNSKVRARAADLVGAPAARPAAPRKKPFLKWL
jgi:eukaryotic-like serine/threonine-protein kinase